MDEISQLKQEVERLKEIVDSLKRPYQFPREITEALMGLGFVRTDGPQFGIVYANGHQTAIVVTPASDATVYVGSANGGFTNTAATFTKGIKTA